MISNDDKTKSVVCPHCNATEIEIISDGLGKCAYCGATIVLPEGAKAKKTNGANVFSAVEEAFGNLRDALNDATSNPNSVIPLHSAKAKKIVIGIAVALAVVVITLAIAIPLSMMDNFNNDTPTSCIHCGSDDYIRNDGDYLYCDNCGGLAVIPFEVRCPECSSTNTVLDSGNATVYCLNCKFDGRLNGEFLGCYHEYGGACDTHCNLCNELRFTTSFHTYSSICDDTCNVCGETTPRGQHTDVNGDGYCEWCGEAM